MCVNCDVPNAPLRQNDLNLLRASAVTRGSNGYRNKSQQKILLPFLLALESATVRSRLHIDLKRALSYSRDHQSGTLCHPVLKICKPSDASRESYIHNLVPPNLSHANYLIAFSAEGVFFFLFQILHHTIPNLSLIHI